MTNDLISVITPYYNDQEFLYDSIESVLSQTYQNWELILINHASSDQSRSIAHSFKDKRIIHRDLSINTGASGNMLVQEGLAVARGKYIKLLSADDILLPTALEQLIHAATRHKAALAFGNISFVDAKKKPLGMTWFTDREPSNQPEYIYLRRFLEGASVFPFAGGLIQTDALHGIRWDCVSVSVADMSLWIHVLLNGGKVTFVNDVLALYRTHDKQMSGIAQLANIRKRAGLEDMQLVHSFLQGPRSVELLQQMLPQSYFAGLLSMEDTEYIPFVMAHYFATQGVRPSYRLAGRLALVPLLSDPIQRDKIQQKFSWGLQNLRADMLREPLYVYNSEEGNAKNASLGKLCYLLLRKCFWLLTLREWRHQRRTKKRTTL